ARPAGPAGARPGRRRRGAGGDGLTSPCRAVAIRARARHSGARQTRTLRVPRRRRMALTSKASTTWTGNLPDGSGRTSLDSSGQGTFDVSWRARAEEHGGTTNPEELIAAAHASCYSMAFAGALGKNGTPPTQ